MRIQVDVRDDDTRVPERLYLLGRAVEVIDVIDRWPGSDYRYVKVAGDDGALYILRFDEMRCDWELTLFASEAAQARPALWLERGRRC
jgi:hypothetical protein